MGQNGGECSEGVECDDYGTGLHRESLDAGDILYLLSGESTVAMVKAGERRQCVIVDESEEIFLFLEPEDLIVASGFGTGTVVMNALKCMIYMIRDAGSPLIVLPKNHLASQRLKYVISAGALTRLSCDITPGTHPNQDVLCAKGELAGVEISGCDGGVNFKNLKAGKFIRMPFTVG